jgi:nitrite reductase/ring-hydroxylating ferredoxin subunit
MSGEDQERFEDYLELEHYIEELQAGHVAHPPAGLTAEQARVYRMAALFRSASPDAAAPRPEFAAQLQARLDQEIQQQQQTQSKPTQTRRLIPLPRRAAKQPGNGRISRRFLIAGGAAVAASLVAGGALDHIVDQATAQHPGSSGTSVEMPLVPRDIPYNWLFVTTEAELGNQAVRFASESVVGFVLRLESDDSQSAARYSSAIAENMSNTQKGAIIAMSAACTHMGCLVHWQSKDRTFVCPCHGGIFTESGGAANWSSAKLYLQPLPRFETKIENGNIYVKVPA